MADLIGPQALAPALNDGGEYALLDVRERGAYARAHLFLAINVPLSRLELRMRQCVPRRTARVFLCDEGGGEAVRAAGVMRGAGYTDVSIVDGGIRNCTGAGFQLFRGHYAVPYAFGLHAARRLAPPALTPQALKARLEASEALVVIDCRTPGEFRQGSIPGAVNLPLGELPYRLRSVAPDPDIPIVVSCGAVTRGVVGGAMLIEAGVANPVAVLENGVRGWTVAGFEVRPGEADGIPPAPRQADPRLAAAAARVARLNGVSTARASDLDRWRDDPERTLYLVDIRTREEFEAGHPAGAVWIPGGELVGLYEDHIATMNARVCLVDADGVRAPLVAAWLTRMGWPDVAVLEGGLAGRGLVTGRPRETVPEVRDVDAKEITPSDLATLIASDNPLVLDFADSDTYIRGHVPGAWWASRARLAERAGGLPAAPLIVATCPDGRLAALAAADLARQADTPLAVLAGGTAAWSDAGRALVTGLTRTLGDVDDVAAEFVVRPGDDPVTVRSAERRMLDWQRELLPTLAMDGTFSFPDLP